MPTRMNTDIARIAAREWRSKELLDTTRVAQREIKKLYKAAENDIKLAARDGMCTVCEWLKTAKAVRRSRL